MMDHATTARSPGEPAVASWETAYATRAGRMGASEIRELLKVLERPDVLSFAGGIPDPQLFPLGAMRAAASDILGDPALGAQALQYSVSEGHAPLRRWIADRMARRGVACDTDNIVITGGSQQGLDFLGKLFLSPGDTALVAAPTYLGALQAFNAYEPRYGHLDPEGGNTTPAAYASAARDAGGRVALAYAVPDFANPTGLTLSRRARLMLLDLCDALGIPLIEDAAYADLRFQGEGVPPCLALDVVRRGHIDASRVIYCGTFSKTISPGLRVGWICAARELVRKVVLAKQAADLHAATLNQMLVHRVAAAEYDALVPRLAAAYAARREAMLAALEAHMPPEVTWTRPEGGMLVWVTLPDAVDSGALLRRALAEANVAFVPGAAFHADGRGRNTLRLSYALQPEPAIREGMRRLGDLVSRVLAHGGTCA